MTATAPLPSPRASTAEAAFLRGVERRAGLLARLQSGDPGQGGAAVAATAREFAGVASRLPMEQWPIRYWSLLLATPELRGPAAGAHWSSPLAWLGGLAPARRAVLLLRLVARLEVDQLAAVLDVPVASVQAALRELLPRHADGSHDAPTWQAQQQALREALDAVPAPASASAQRAPAAIPVPRTTMPTPGRGRRRLLLAVFVACLAALAATFVFPLRLPLRAPPAAGSTRPAEAVPLPPYQAPSLVQDPDLVLLAHPDFEQLAAAADTTLVRDLGLYSWYAARRFERRDAAAAEAGDAD